MTKSKDEQPTTTKSIKLKYIVNLYPNFLSEGVSDTTIRKN